MAIAAERNALRQFCLYVLPRPAPLIHADGELLGAPPVMEVNARRITFATAGTRRPLRVEPPFEVIATFLRVLSYIPIVAFDRLGTLSHSLSIHA